MPPPPPQVAEIMERLGLDMLSCFAQRYADIGRMREHGVRVVPGVDSGAMPLKAHGNAWIAVTDLVTGGWPVDEALAAGTAGAADACGVGDVTGRLGPALRRRPARRRRRPRGGPPGARPAGAVWVRGIAVTPSGRAG